MAVELGSAYLSIGASTDGFAKDVNRALGNSEREAGRSGRRGGSMLGKGLATGLKVVGGAVAGVTAAIGGLALKGGFERALAIENAQAKLKGLGHDTKSIETIMDSALDSVKGTAYGLGDAATVAASTVAAGVKPGEDLTRTLKLVGDAATIAGTDMGSMGGIFNKVAASNKVQMDVINQLHDAGIPALAALADEMGVTAEEASKMASRGEIDFATFQNAMEGSLGGAALASGDTFEGALANVYAALGRFGEKFATPLKDSLRGIFNDAIPAIDALTDKIGPFAEKFGEWLGDAVAKTQNAVPQIIDGIKGVWAILSGDGFQGRHATFGLEEDSPIVDILFTLRERLEDVWAAGEQIYTRLAPVFEQLWPVVQEFVSSFSPLTLVLDLLEPIIPVVADGLAQIGEAVGGALTAAMPHLTTMVEALSVGLEDVVVALMPLIPALLDLLPALTPLIGPFAELIAELLPPLIDLLLALVDPIVDLLVPALGLLADYLTNVHVPALKIWWDILGTVLGGVIDFVTGVIKWFTDLRDTIVLMITEGTDAIEKMPESIRKPFENAGTWLYEAGRNIVQGLIGGIESMWNTAKEKVQSFGNSVSGWFKDRLGISSPSKVFAGFGKWIVRGLSKGIVDSRDDAAKAITALGDRIAAAGEKAVKKEADRLIKARERENKRLQKAGKKSLGLLSRADAEKQARRNLKAELGAQKAAQRILDAQNKRTGASRSDLLAGLTRGGNVRKGAAGREIKGFTLADIARARESVAKSLAAARDTLADLRAERAQMRDQVASSIRSELDLTAGIGQATTDALGRQSAGVTTFASVAGVVKTMAAKAKTFATLLGRLRKAGIPAGLIQEIAGYGTEQGTEVAKALLSGSATQIKELAADFTSLENWSKKAGEYVAGATFDTAIAAQQGLIQGLEADDAKLEKAAKKLAKKLVKAVKKALGIKSPSRLFRDEIGTMLPAGIIDGIDDGQPALDARVAGMVPTPNVPTPRGMAGNEAGADSTDLSNLSIEVHLHADRQFASAIVRQGVQEVARTDRAVLRTAFGV